MKRGKLLILPLLGTLILTSLFSCGVDRWPEYYPETGRDIWIDSVMRQEYLWYKDMPSPAAPDYFQEPAEFLKKAVASMDKGFSNIDSLLEELSQAMASTIAYIKCLITIRLIML